MLTAKTPPQSFHAYVYGSSFWYFVRGACRIYDPEMVAGWFRPEDRPANSKLPLKSCLTPSPPPSPPPYYLHTPGKTNAHPTTDLELYNIRTDALGLWALAILTIILAGVPGATSSSSAQAIKPYAKAAIWGTVFHHITTAVLAYQQYAGPNYTQAMTVGWVFSSGLAVLGAYAATVGLSGQSRALKKNL